MGASGNVIATDDDGALQASRYETGYGYITASGARFYYHRDHLGNVRAVSNASGNSVRWTDYFAYGAIRDEWNIGQVRDNYRYNSKELDTETGLLYYGARYFEPLIGLWTATDPAREYPSAYIYVGNRPMIAIDPDGRRTLIDKDGVVTQILNDGDKSVWQQRFTDDGAEYYIQVGETEFIDEFAKLSEETGLGQLKKNGEEFDIAKGAKITVGDTWDFLIEAVHNEAMNTNTINLGWQSQNGQFYDIKSWKGENLLKVVC